MWVWVSVSLSNQKKEKFYRKTILACSSASDEKSLVVFTAFALIFDHMVLGMGQAGFCPSQVKSSFFENQNFKLKYFSNIWLSSLIKPSFFNYKIFKPSQAQIYWVSSQVKSSIFNILIFKSNQVKLKLFDLTCQVAWTFFSKNLISIDLNWKNLYWNCKLT